MKILVTIASFGTKNDRYLDQVIGEYRSMSHQVEIVVFSNLQKHLGQDVTSLVVDLRGRDPHTLPFAHKKIMANRVADFDLFIYTEDDTVISERNLDAFLKVSSALPANEIPGFLNTDIGPTGDLHFCNMSSFFHWDPGLLVTRGDYRFAYFTNGHSASFVLTQGQLRRAISSGGFLVEPHEGRYNWACSAATDPYTQCGFKKLICISHLEDFLIRHLPDKYSARPYGGWHEVRKQLDALAEAQRDGAFRGLLFQPETKLLHGKWSRSYYEPVNLTMASLIPKTARSVLSLGCAWGATEGHLVGKGLRVVGVPMDSVIASCAEDKGVEIVYGDFAAARRKLQGETFDCILLSNVLPLVSDPIDVLSTFAPLLAAGGRVLASAPNLGGVAAWFERLRGKPYYRGLGDYEETGVHLTSRRQLRKWFASSDLKMDRLVEVVSEARQRAARWTLGLATPILAEELIAVGRRA
jgi:2-polyprenyl-3-methyl-5-hydroxy-6-metoxy-1,4-benzoquinol methylase